ncbi:MAG: AAA family ATPase [Candidatus Pacearchaeota archaeon]
MLIIGLTGTKASGKGEIASYLKSKGFVYFSLSDVVREEAERRGLKNYSVKDLQDIGNDLRSKYGASILAKIVIEKIKKEIAEGKSNFVIDGIRNPAEVIEFKKMENFFLIAVDAPKQKRFEWLIARNRQSDPKNYEEFLKIDARDLGLKESAIGQQVKLCMKLAKFKIYNNSTIEKLHEKIEKILKKLKA